MTQKKDTEKTADREIHFVPGAREIMQDDSTAQVKVVRVGRKSRGRQILSPEDAFDFWKRIVARRPWFDADRECFVALLLDVKNNLKGWNLVGAGTDKSCLVDAKGVFRCAVACSACTVLVMHNHPSGCCSPSREDVRLTRRLVQNGKLLDIEVLDHVVVGDAEFCSFKEDHHEVFEVSLQSALLAAESPEICTA